MKKSLFVFIGIAVCLLCTVAAGIAGVPQMINFQGRLIDEEDSALDDTLSITFSIYADSTGGTALWTETNGSVIVSKGIFNVLLGSIESIPNTVFTGAERWLGMTVGSDNEMTPRKPIVSVGYAFHSATSDTAEYVLSSIPPDASVSQAKLKTAIGEVFTSGGGDGDRLTLPGGSYGFYPQLKCANTDTKKRGAWPYGRMDAGGDMAWANAPGWTSYTTLITLLAESGVTFYAQQRYITASGKDHWIFLLYDKTQGRIIAGWEAPDHPSYGQGGDENEIPHPFFDYFGKPLPDSLEIVLVDNDIIDELKAKRTKKKGIFELIGSEYQLDMSKEGKYTPRDISDETGRHWNVERIPDYMKVRRLKRRVLE